MASSRLFVKAIEVSMVCMILGAEVRWLPKRMDFDLIKAWRSVIKGDWGTI